MPKPPLPLNVRGRDFPDDPDFPQLKIATDPGQMLEVFRKHLKPVSAGACHIEECIPYRFRCRQATSRCVLQYILRLVEPASNRQWNQWATGFVYGKSGKAEQLRDETQVICPPVASSTLSMVFQPVTFIPELAMLVQVFPFDRKLHNLRKVVNGGACSLEPPLLERLGPGRWAVQDR